MLSEDQTLDRLRRTLAAAFGLPGGPIPTRIHPDDEMYRDALRRRGSHSQALREYMYLGNQSAWTIRQIAEWSGLNWTKLDAVLDFAAGYGRVSRFLLHSLSPSKVWISEVLVKAVPFQVDTFGVHGIRSAMDPEAVQFPRRFDLISVLSLFTHLPRPTFTTWLQRLCAAVADGGVLLFTTHGAEVFAEAFARPLTTDFFFEPLSENDELDKNAYGRTYTQTSFVLDQLARIPGIDVLGHIPRGLGGYQDIFVVGRGRNRPTEPAAVRPMPQGCVDAVHGPRDGMIHLVGWGLDGRYREPLQRVTVLADDAVIGDAKLGEERDLSSAFGPDANRRGGWIASVPYRGWQPEWLSIAMQDQAGVCSVFTRPAAEVVVLGKT
jgi:SAM-dependent methyltransferase